MFLKKEQCLFQINKILRPMWKCLSILPSTLVFIPELPIIRGPCCSPGPILWERYQSQEYSHLFYHLYCYNIFFSSTWSFKLQCPHCKGPKKKKLSIVTLSHSAPLQAPVVQRLDSAIHPIITIQWTSITEINYAIRWIVIYPVDSAIQRFNNRSQAFKRDALKIIKVLLAWR